MFVLARWILARGVGRYHEVAAAVGAHVKNGKLGTASARSQVARDGFLQVLLHESAICALRELAALVDPTLNEDALGLLGRDEFRFAQKGHLELFKRRFGELLLDFLLEIHQFKLNLRVNVPFTFQGPASKCNDVAIGGSLITSYVFFTLGNPLADTVLIVRFGQSVLAVGAGWLVRS